MNSKLFTKIDGSVAQNFLKGDEVDKTELGLGSENDKSEALEHVYIVFADGTDIDSGIAVIEQEVLGGEALNVTRKDTSGNAVVAIVPGNVRKQIEGLLVVTKVKVDEGAEVKKNTESAESTDSESTEAVETVSPQDFGEIDSDESVKVQESSTQAQSAKDNTDNSENTDAAASSEAVSYGELRNDGIIDPKGIKGSWGIAITGVILLALAIFVIRRFFRKNR